MHNYIFTPSREPWPSSSVNSRLGKVPLLDANGNPLLDESGKPREINANVWLDQHRSVEQMTWAPGLPMLIHDRLISDGGWIERRNVTCLNLYRPPAITPGNAADATPWLDHVRRVYPEDADYLINWMAQRVQQPAVKIHAVLLGGEQGIGKDTMLEPVKRAVGPWNFAETSPQQILGRFNGFLKSVSLRISEARDLGDINRFQFYEHMKAYTAAPPDVLRVDEKNLQEHSILNCTGVVITTNKKDSLFLPADDRRHFVAWPDLIKDHFDEAYCDRLWRWYDDGGDRHVAAYLAQLDLSAFNPKAPPPKTPVFWQIVETNRAPEDSELADVLDRMGNPDATTIEAVAENATCIAGDFYNWITDRKNRRVIPHRMEQCGYVSVRNPTRKDGLWLIGKTRRVIYAKAELSIRKQHEVAADLVKEAAEPEVAQGGGT